MIPQTQYSEQLIYSKLNLLSSEPLKKKLIFYIDYLLVIGNYHTENFR